MSLRGPSLLDVADSKAYPNADCPIGVTLDDAGAHIDIGPYTAINYRVWKKLADKGCVWGWPEQYGSAAEALYAQTQDKKEEVA